MTPTTRTAPLENPATTPAAPLQETTDWLMDESDVTALSNWFDEELENLEHQFQSFCTRDSLMSSISR